MALDEADLKIVNDLIGKSHTAELPAIKARIAEAIAPIAETCRKLTDSVAAIPTAGVKPETVQKLVSEQVTINLAAAREADKKTSDAAAAQQKIAEARQKFLTEKAGKIPAIYHQLVPVTDDPAKLEEGLAAAIEAVKKDVGSLGAKLPDLGSPAGGSSSDNQEAARAAQAAASAERSKANPFKGLADAYAAEARK